MNWLLSIFMNLNILLAMPFFFEAMFPKWTICRISLVFVFVVGTPEEIGARFTLLYFESRRVNFIICLTAPCKFSMIYGLMWAIIFYTFCPLNSVYVCRVALFPAIFALEDASIHISASNGGDESSYVKSLVNKGFGFGTALSISNINPYYCYVWLWRYLDYSRFWG